MKKQKNYEIDWIDFDLHVDGNVEKITDGSILYTTLYLDTIDDVYQLSEALLHKDLKCKAPLIEPNLRRNLGKWST